MRKRNHKLNIYLNDNELNLLKEKSSNLGLNQSDYIRNIINKDFDFNNKNIIYNELIDIINNIVIIKNQMRLMGYSALENKLLDVQNKLNLVIKMIKDNE